MALVAGLLLLTLAVAGCERPAALQTLSGLAQGTLWELKFWTPAPTDIPALQQQIEEEFARLDAVLSNYRPDSVIEGFNANSGTAPVAVGGEILGLIEAAEQVSLATQGCYDLTIKPLFDLWGFGGDALTPPPPSVLSAALARVGFRQLAIEPPDRLRKRLAGMRVDLSSIAQGYSVGRVAALLEDAGIQNYVMEIGGELQARGRKPDGSPWRIAIERPVPGERRVHKALTIGRDRALAVMTSGTYRHYFDAQGKRYSHVIDARTGRPIEHATVSVTVVGSDPTLADAWSTALLCLGQEAGIGAADRAGIAALFISDSDGQLRERASTAWLALDDVTAP